MFSKKKNYSIKLNTNLQVIKNLLENMTPLEKI